MGTSSAPTTTVPPKPATSRVTSIAPWAVLSAVFLASYWDAVGALVSDWYNDPGYSFGLIIPFVIAYIIYMRRDALLAEPKVPSSVAGLAVILFSQLMFIAGNLSAEFFLQRSSIVVLAAGAILYVAGWGWLKRLILPLSLFQLCIPLPAVILQEISIPLQLVSSSGAASLLRLLGIPVYRAGNIIQLPTQTLSVTEACSGLRSLASMIALALVLVSMSRLSRCLRALVIVSGVAVAVISNSLRITGTGVLGEYFGRHATLGIWHSLEGWFVFVTAFLMLFAEVAILQRFFGKPEARSNA